jgi:pimeloyl-ACP methyl ester carboxylesterase
MFHGSRRNTIILLVTLAFVPFADAQNSGTLSVSATADLWRAGGFVLPVNPGNFGTGDVPPEIPLVAGANDSITISASGSWNCGLGFGGPGGSPCGPFPNVNVIGVGGISGIEVAAHTLSGVFLDDTNPPDVIACNRIGKVFPIGNGGTFKVPPTATRLILGLPDECSGGANTGGTPGCYGDNSGAVTATFTLTPSSSSSNSEPRSRFTLVDPVPDLLTTSGLPSITANQSDLGDSSKGRSVDGVAADGVAQVVVRIPTCVAGEDITVQVLNDLKVPSNSSDDDGGLARPGTSSLSAFQTFVSVTATTPSTPDEQPLGFVIYRAPTNFSGGLSDSASLPLRTVFLQIKSPSLSEPIIRKVTIIRPPVILIHGLWSSKSAWVHFLPGLAAAHFDATPLDYSQSNAGSVHQNATLLLPQLRNSIRGFAIASNVAAVQADVVAHSMGGLITRRFAQIDGFIDDRNYATGYVHRLISIDTPHQGSLLANRLISSPLDCHKLFFLFNTSADGGAVRDLAVGSLMINALMSINGSQHAIPAHAVIGIANRFQESLTESEWLLQGLSLGCGLLPNNKFQLLFHGPSDLIVAESSQDAAGVAVGFASPFASRRFDSLIHAQDRFLFKFGPDVLSSQDVLDHVRFVLDSPINSSDFFPIRPTF